MVILPAGINMYVCYWCYGGNMYEENHVLSKIEQWVDKLPYRSVKIEVELPDKTLVLTKDRQRTIGFRFDSK